MTSPDRAAQYVDQLEAHMDENGTTGPNNIRDLIQMIRELSARNADLTRERDEAVTSIPQFIRSERERCAKIAEGWIEHFGHHDPSYVSAKTWASDAVKDIAAAIRSPADTSGRG